MLIPLFAVWAKSWHEHIVIRIKPETNEQISSLIVSRKFAPELLYTTSRCRGAAEGWVPCLYLIMLTIYYDKSIFALFAIF